MWLFITLRMPDFPRLTAAPNGQCPSIDVSLDQRKLMSYGGAYLGLQRFRPPNKYRLTCFEIGWELMVINSFSILAYILPVWILTFYLITYYVRSWSLIILTRLLVMIWLVHHVQLSNINNSHVACCCLSSVKHSLSIFPQVFVAGIARWAISNPWGPGPVKRITDSWPVQTLDT